MHLTIAYSKIKRRNLVLINNDTYQRETVSARPIRQPLNPNQLFINAILILTTGWIFDTHKTSAVTRFHILKKEKKKKA